jgi:hypothetical protein
MSLISVYIPFLYTFICSFLLLFSTMSYFATGSCILLPFGYEGDLHFFGTLLLQHCYIPSMGIPLFYYHTTSTAVTLHVDGRLGLIFSVT